jgi:hypothetical protein
VKTISISSGTLYLYFAIFSGIFFMPLQNLAVCWKIFSNIRQPAGNLHSYLNKRILRDFTQELSILLNIFLIRTKILFFYVFLHKNVFYLHTKTNLGKNKYPLNLKDNQLGYYLAGLIEADGSIIIPKEESKNTPAISISFNIEDKPLAVCIKNQLGFGSLENIEKYNAVKLIIIGKYNILTLISLINGKFRTPKIEKLHKLINYVNKN